MPDDRLPPAQVDLGIVLTPRAADRLRRALTEDLPARLGRHLSGVRWHVTTVDEELVTPPAEALELFDSARDRMLDEDWDLVLVLTDLPLRQGRRTVVSQASPVHRVGLLSLPALGAVHVRQRVLDAAVHLLDALVGHDPGDRGVTRRLSELSTDRPVPTEANPVQLAARVLGGNLRVLLGMIRANRPWRLAMGLSRALTVAVATGVLALVTADLWLLSTAYGPWRLVGLGVLSVGAVTLTLIVGGGLWERPRRPREREQVALFNLATTATVVIGVLVFYLVLFLLSLLGALLLVEPTVLTATIGQAAGPAEFAKLAWLTATLATVGGALGAGLETDDTVHQAAYTRHGAADLPARDR